MSPCVCVSGERDDNVCVIGRLTSSSVCCCHEEQLLLVIRYSSSYLILKHLDRPSVAQSTAYFSGTKGPRELRFFAVDRGHASHSAVEGHFVVGHIGAELEVKEGFLKYLKLDGRFWNFLEIPLYVHIYTASHILHIDGNFS